ncbi:MAG: TolC family protein [Vulcanimicrobiaceae bacterium]
MRNVKAPAFGLASIMLSLSVAAGATRSEAQPAATQSPIPTVAPYVLPSAVPPAASPIPIPSTELPPVPAVGPGYNVSPGPLPTPGIAGVSQEPYVGISLDDAVTMALMRNPNLAVSQANRRIAAYQVVAAEGAYDVRFQLVPSYTHTVQPPSSFFAAGPNAGPITADTLGVTGGFSGQTLGGTRLSVSGTGSRVTSNAVANSYNPSYPSALSFNVTQPLARGLRMDDARRALEIARIAADTDTDALLVNAQQTVSNVANTYWSLVAAWRNVAIQEEGLRNAVAQAQSTQRQAKAGAVAPVDVVESNDQVAQFQDNVYSGLQTVQELQTQLKSLILGNPADPVWSANLVPTTSVTQMPVEPTVNDVLVAALGNRPEIAQIRDQERAAKVNVSYAKDQLKPQLDLGLGYTSNGFAGNPINPMASPVTGLFLAEANAIDQLIAIANATLPPAQRLTPLPPLNFAGPGYLNGNFGTSVNNLFSNDFPTYSAQLTIGLPLRNRAARGNYGAALEQARSLEVQQIGLIQRLKMESANAVQMLRSAQSRLIAAQSGRQAAEQVYASELRKYHAGTSTTFLVLQRVINLANDRGRELQAQTDVNKALVNIQLVEGKLLAGYNIDTGAIGTQTLMLTGSTDPGTAAPAVRP